MRLVEQLENGQYGHAVYIAHKFDKVDKSLGNYLNTFGNYLNQDP